MLVCNANILESSQRIFSIILHTDETFYLDQKYLDRIPSKIPFE